MKAKRILTFILSLSFMLSTAIFASGAGASDPANAGNSIEQIISLISKIPKEEFGGIYINENGTVVVNLTENISTRSRTATRVMLPETVKIECVKYSLSELEAMKTALEPYMLKYNIATLDANEVTNTIDVQLFEKNKSVYNLIDSLKAVDPDIVNVTVLDSDLYISPTVADAPPETYPKEFASMYGGVSPKSL